MDNKRLTFVTGHYGSGKTEFAINHALKLKESYDKVSLVDLDVVNIYFRSRDVRNLLSEKNIELISSHFKEDKYVDLPAISPRIYSPLDDKSKVAIYDVGGNSVGAGVVSMFRDRIDTTQIQVLAIVNKNRPETMDENSSIEMIKSIEKTSRLKITGIINNTHMLQYTTIDDILSGYQMCENISKKINVPMLYNVVKSDLDIDFDKIPNIYFIDTFLRENWMK